MASGRGLSASGEPAVSIEGYKHTPGVKNVVRLKRFQRASAPADASKTVYVLDLVVQSETVKP